MLRSGKNYNDLTVKTHSGVPRAIQRVLERGVAPLACRWSTPGMEQTACTHLILWPCRICSSEWREPVIHHHGRQAARASPRATRTIFGPPEVEYAGSHQSTNGSYCSFGIRRVYAAAELMASDMQRAAKICGVAPTVTATDGGAVSHLRGYIDFVKVHPMVLSCTAAEFQI